MAEEAKNMEDILKQYLLLQKEKGLHIKKELIGSLKVQVEYAELEARLAEANMRYFAAISKLGSLKAQLKGETRGKNGEDSKQNTGV